MVCDAQGSYLTSSTILKAQHPSSVHHGLQNRLHNEMYTGHSDPVWSLLLFVNEYRDLQGFYLGDLEWR